MWDDSAALSIIRLAIDRGLLARETETLFAGGEDTSSAQQRSPAQLLAELLAQGRLTFDAVSSLREQVAAAQATQGDGCAAAAVKPDGEDPPRFAFAHERYEIEHLLGQGGMGQVYKARDIKLSRQVALKFLHVNDDQTRQRLFHEARAQARIAHPSICQVYDVGQHAGQLYIAMEYHEGESLRSARSNLTLEERVVLIKQVAEALQAAHLIGIIHRDIKSSNILATKTSGEGWRAVLLDFGLARDLEASEQMTRTGAILGTPAYMSPEQLRGDHAQIDRRTDIYSTGAVLYELLTGAPPFAGDPQLLAWRTLHEEVTAPRRHDPSIPIDLETITLTCLQKEPHRRYQSAQALADDLARYLAGQPIAARKASLARRARRFLSRHWAPVGIAALLLLAISGVLAVWVRDQRQAERRARLAQQLGREVELSDMFLRMAYSFPLHDLNKEEAVVRQRISRIQQQLISMPPLEASLAHYAIGRSQLMLRSYDDAISHLEKALAQGLEEPEVEEALGRALGARYQQAKAQLDLAREDDWISAQLARLSEQYLVPARSHLQRGYHAQSGEALLNKSLLALYRDEYEQALEAASAVLAVEPWRPEAKKVLGDVQAAISGAQRNRGNFGEARRALAKAYEHYQEALLMSRSDPSCLLAAAQLHIDEMSLSLYLGESPLPAFSRCTARAADLQTLLPDSVAPRAVRLRAVVILLRYLNDRSANIDVYEAQALADIQFIAQREPNNPVLLHAEALTYLLLSESRLRHGQPFGNLVKRTEQAARRAILRQENPARVYQLLCDVYSLAALQHDYQNVDIAQDVQNVLDTARSGMKLFPHRESFYETALRIYRRATTRLDMLAALPAGWLDDAEAVARQALQQVKDPSFAEHHIGGMYLDMAELKLQRGEDPLAFLDKAEPHIRRALQLLPTHALVHSDLASLYRLRALSAMRNGREHAGLLAEAQAAVRSSLKLNAQDGDCQLAQGRVLLAVAESELRQRHDIDKILAEVDGVLSRGPFLGSEAASAELLRADVQLLRAQASPAANRPALLEAARRHIEQTLLLRPKWPLAQQRKQELQAALQPSH